MDRWAPGMRRPRKVDTDWLLREQEVADILGVTYYTLIRWRNLGKSPSYVRLDPSPERNRRKALNRYWASDVLSFIESWCDRRAEAAAVRFDVQSKDWK